MENHRTSLRAEHRATFRLLVIVGSLAAVAPALARPLIIELNFPIDTLELRPNGIGGTGLDGVEWITFKSMKERPRPPLGGQVYESTGVWANGLTFEAPNPVGPGDDLQSLVGVKFRSMPPREAMNRRAQTIPGVDIIIKKTPSDKAAYWDTRGSDTGVIVDLPDSLGSLASWPGGLSADASLITGALYADFDGTGETRRAVQWINGGMAEFLPAPPDSQYSEAFGTSLNGTSVGCFKAIKEPRVQRDPRHIPAEGAKGMIWHPGGGYTVIEPSAAGPDAASIVLTGITDDAQIAMAVISTTRSNSKGSLCTVSTGDVIVLDGGDINGDGVINLLDDHNSNVYALSLDASIVGGSISLVPGEEQAAVWLRDPDGSYAPQSLAVFLSSYGVTGMEGWDFSAVTAISPDGQILTGWGTSPAGHITGWVATVPTPGGLALAGLAGLVLTRRRR